MLRFAIFSDIHSNLEGLQVVLEEAERLEADVLLCCGDIIGYNADPNACVELVRAKGVRCIQGNHERGLRELDEDLEPNMNPIAMEALLYTSETLSEDNRGWLLSLPDEMAVEDAFYLFHGSPADPDDYIFDAFEAAYAFKSLASEHPSPANLVCFIGHTHICAAYMFDAENHRVGERATGNGDRFLLKPGAHYMFNAGSCGQYRGGLPIATLILMDSDAMTAEFHFLRYDVATTQSKILASGLPALLAQRLGMGQ
jgi:predicted phosphodiesterase